MNGTGSDNARLTPYFFAIEIDGISCARFKKCDGLEIYNDVFEYEEGGYNLSTRKFIGYVHYQNIVLESGVSYNRSLFDWFHYSTLWDNERERKSGSIVLMNSSWDEIRRWNFFRAFPCKWIGPSLISKLSAEYAIEKIEIAYDHLEEDINVSIPLEITESDDSVKIRRAFNKLKYSEFGNTERGKEIVGALERHYDKISIAELPIDTRAQVTRVNARNEIKIISIKINRKWENDLGEVVDMPEEALPGRLAHEGTHLLYRDQGIVNNSFREERECFDNAYILDVELNSPIQDNPTDEELRERYQEFY